jgi:hypothetical protein
MALLRTDPEAAAAAAAVVVAPAVAVAAADVISNMRIGR